MLDVTSCQVCKQATHCCPLNHEVEDVHNNVEEEGERESPCRSPRRLEIKPPGTPLTTNRVEEVSSKPQITAIHLA
jgi:hypothetical protein